MMTIPFEQEYKGLDRTRYIEKERKKVKRKEKWQCSQSLKKYPGLQYKEKYTFLNRLLTSTA